MVNVWSKMCCGLGGSMWCGKEHVLSKMSCINLFIVAFCTIVYLEVGPFPRFSEPWEHACPHVRATIDANNSSSTQDDWRG